MMHAHLWGREQAIHHLLNKSLRSLPWQQTTILRTQNQISFFVSSPSCTTVKEAKSWSSVSYSRFHATQVPTRERETHTHTRAHIQKHWQRDGDNKQALNENTITGRLIPSASSSAKRLFFSFFESPDNREQRRERGERENRTYHNGKTKHKNRKKKNRFQVKQQTKKKTKGKRTNETYLLLASLKVPWFTADQRNQATAMNEFLSGLCFLPCPSLPPRYYPHKQIWRTCFEQQTEDSSSLFLFRKKRSRFPSTEREREREREREYAIVWRLFLERNLDFPTQIAMLTAFRTTKELRSCHKQQQACTLVVRFFFRARALARPLPSRSHRRQQRKKKNPSFLRSSLGLFVVYEPYPHSYTIKIYTITYTWIRKNTN